MGEYTYIYIPTHFFRLGSQFFCHATAYTTYSLLFSNPSLSTPCSIFVALVSAF
ncbi:predicted protein [Plenodomus lingam JN3]|uniref:Predicted protein n=1 Tax=Leptosphaeria maculans (strain JN3 / isolate v23.1.3 / race Av1-4-5-6-7-8) TaxID=985895 RepID=E4ZYE4_LEPMJ|nr:predicted protein [Plenodomus lingam JN3]CBX96389.1 predicted protein [Plenodomus lingam JN3]